MGGGLEVVAIGGDLQATGFVATVEWWLLGFYAALALGVSFLCSLLEAALLTISRPRIALLIEQGRRSGVMLQRMKDDIDRPLAAILTLNTVAHTMGAAGVGAQVLVIFGDRWVAAASVIITVLILVFSEIIPKTLGATHARGLADFTARAVRAITFLTYPVVAALEVVSRSLGSAKAGWLTRDEVRVVADLGEHSGVLEQSESRVIRNLLRLRDIQVTDVMTPRTVLFAVDRGTSVGELTRAHNPIPFTRIPVYEGTPDHILGVVLKHDVLAVAREGHKDRPLRSLARPLHAVPETTPVNKALEQFLSRREHLFLVVDEFGGTAGVITLEDALETLLGTEIVDETDVVADMRKLARARQRRRPIGRPRPPAGPDE